MKRKRSEVGVSPNGGEAGGDLKKRGKGSGIDGGAGEMKTKEKSRKRKRNGFRVPGNGAEATSETPKSGKISGMERTGGGEETPKKRKKRRGNNFRILANGTETISEIPNSGKVSRTEISHEKRRKRKGFEFRISLNGGESAGDIENPHKKLRNPKGNDFRVLANGGESAVVDIRNPYEKVRKRKGNEFRVSTNGGETAGEIQNSEKLSRMEGSGLESHEKSKRRKKIESMVSANGERLSSEGLDFGKGPGKDRGGKGSETLEKSKKRKKDEFRFTPNSETQTERNGAIETQTVQASRKRRKKSRKDGAQSNSNSFAVKSGLNAGFTMLEPKRKKPENGVVNDVLKVAPPAPAENPKPTRLLDNMRARLSGGRFRMLNETLYTCKGEDAFKLFKRDPASFNLYHVGYQEQMSKWPVLPVEVVISWLRSRSSKLVVADFGCGDARLAKNVKNKVFSLDLVSNDPSVIACNMAQTPLPTASIDVAVFCLSLMGTDYPSFLQEAHRVLKASGSLLIAEVKSRFDAENGGASPQEFIQALRLIGFSLVSQDVSNKMFIMFYLKKEKDLRGKREQSKRWPELKACMYKRR